MTEDSGRQTTPTRSLRRTYVEVRQTLFPRWDRERHWRIRIGTVTEGCGEEGYCLTGSQVILVQAYVASGNREHLRFVIAHEIAHAVRDMKRACHGKTWQRIMTSAAGRARRNGWTAVGALIEADWQYFSANPSPPARYLYDDVPDDVEAMPQRAFSDYLREVAQRVGVSPAQLNVGYPGLRRVYEREVARLRRSAQRAKNLQVG